MVWVKICGITNLQDAQAAVDAGADALGFIFADSPRRIAPLVAQNVVRSLPEHVEKIGVFVNESAERVHGLVKELGLTGVQLHGYRTLEVPMRIKEEGTPSGALQVTLGFPMPLSGEIGDELFQFGNADRILFDTAVNGKAGGSGLAWNWEMGKAFLEIVRDIVKVVVAGGLAPINVAEAVRILHPWGVDVSSGVEREPGKKDHDKVKAFVKAAKAVGS
jgi:phosphoribosylanthranilate isomerase